tara:strand:+ start:332 stop:1300 length:969 start_codon:yes stop_codon:yes gene_type:complete
MSLDDIFQDYLVNQTTVDSLAHGIVLEDRSSSWIYKKRSSEMNSELSVDSPFQIGSLSKLLTACVVLQLCKLGFLDLYSLYPISASDQSICFTLDELLRHRSGILGPQGYLGFRLGEDSQQSFPELEVEIRENFNGNYKTRYHYSGINYRAIQFILESQLGQTYRDLLKIHLCEPLGLFNTSSSFADFNQLHLVKGFDQHQTMIPDGWHSFVGIEAAAGIWSSLFDLSKLMSELLLHKEGSVTMDGFHVSWRDLINTHCAEPYRYGCFVSKSSSLIKIGHSGRNPGFQSLFWFTPALRKGVITLWNTDQFDKQIASISLKLL